MVPAARLCRLRSVRWVKQPGFPNNFFPPFPKRAPGLDPTLQTFSLEPASTRAYSSAKEFKSGRSFRARGARELPPPENNRSRDGSARTAVNIVANAGSGLQRSWVGLQL